MMRLILAGFFVFIMLFLATTFQDSEAARERARPFFTAEQIDVGLQFAFERRLFYWASVFIHLGFLTLLVATSIARRVTDRWHELVGGRWWLTVLLVGATYFLAVTALTFPVSVGRFFHNRAWGMSARPLPDWLIDFAKSGVITAVNGAIVLTGFYLLLRWFPRRWWLPATAASTVLIIVYAFLLPILIEPVFNTFTPLSKTEWAGMEPSVRALIGKANVPVDDILVVDASRQGNHSNAYFTGFGATRRIVLYDTLLKKHPADEVLSIVGHELGHWQNDHIVKGIALAMIATLCGLFILSRILLWVIGRGPLALKAPSDPAGLPLILLLSVLAGWLTDPMSKVVSRHFERQADTAALELAGDPRAFERAEIRLAVTNKSNVAPTDFSVWLFASHPTHVNRIQMARSWLLDRPATKND